jgi:hypothetical protein
MLGTDAGIVQPSGNRVRFLDLAVVILQKIGAVAMKNTWFPAVHRRGVAVLHI